MNRAARNEAVSGQMPNSRAADARVPIWRSGWERWKQIARAVGVVQTRFIMILFYFVMVVPLGLFVRWKEDRLRLRPPQGPLWVPHPENKHTLDRARKQY